MSQLFAWGSRSIGVSALASVLPMNIQYWVPLGWTGLISLQSKGLSRVFSNTTVQKHQFFGPRWEGLGAGGEGDNRGWDGWMASLIQWTWVWASSVSWWWTGKPDVLQSLGSQRVGHYWATELNWTEHTPKYVCMLWHILDWWMAGCIHLIPSRRANDNFKLVHLQWLELKIYS